MCKLPLRSFQLKNFKAVRDSRPVKLGALTVFIGNNGSGKSSLIEGLETYCDVVIGGVDRAFEKWLGLDHVWNKAVQHRQRVSKDEGVFYENPVSFKLAGQIGRGAFKSVLEVGMDVGKNQTRIEREFLQLPSGQTYTRDSTGRCESFNDEKRDRARKVEKNESAAPQDWINHLRRWQFLRLSPELMRQPARTHSTGEFPALARDGSNIGQYLLSLRDSSLDAYEDLVEAMRFVIPYARDLQTAVSDSIERRAYLELTEAEFKVPGWLLSTGTLRIVAILACLRHPNPPPLLVIEEIENGLDPRTLHLVVEEIRAAITAGTTQVILTTHSPYLLDLLDLSHIVVVERDNGQPVFRRPDAKELAKWAKDFSPGRLYTMGRLTRGDQ